MIENAEKYRAELTRQAIFRFHLDDDAAEEVVQNTFIKLLEREVEVNDERHLRNLLHLMLRQEAIDYQRKWKRDMAHVSADEEALSGFAPRHEHVEDQIIYRDLRDKTLDGEELLAYTLVMEEGHTVRDAADMVGWGKSTMNRKVMTAAAKLAEVGSDLFTARTYRATKNTKRVSFRNEDRKPLTEVIEELG